MDIRRSEKFTLHLSSCGPKIKQAIDRVRVPYMRFFTGSINLKLISRSLNVTE